MILLALLIGIGLFWAVVLVLNRRYDLKKRGITLEGGALLWRTKRGLQFIDRTASAHKRSWIALGSVAAAAGVMLMFYIAFALFLNLYIILTWPPELAPPGVRLVLPEAVPGGILGLPVHWWLVAIGSVLLVHEFSHGFLMRAQGIPTKSIGGLFFIAIPGGFVEPDEKALKASPISKRLRVYGAGSFANILFALLCLGLILSFLAPKPTVQIGEFDFPIAEGSPAWKAGLGGSRLLKIDNVEIAGYRDFSDFMENTMPGQRVLISTDRENLQLELERHPENENRGYFGIYVTPVVHRSEFLSPGMVALVMFQELMGRQVFHQHAYESIVPWGLVDLLKWMFVLNLAIGLFNLLPMVPLDGGYIMQALIEWRSSRDRARRVSHGISIVMLAVLILNFIPHLW